MLFVCAARARCPGVDQLWANMASENSTTNRIIIMTNAGDNGRMLCRRPERDGLKECENHQLYRGRR